MQSRLCGRIGPGDECNPGAADMPPQPARRRTRCAQAAQGARRRSASSSTRMRASGIFCRSSCTAPASTPRNSPTASHCARRWRGARPISSSSTSRSNRPMRSNASSRSATRAIAAIVQLMSSRGSAVLEHVKSIGDQHRLQMLPVAQEAVRDRRHPENTAGPQARRAAVGRRPHRSRRGLAQWLDRILVPAEDRPAQETAGRRRGVRARPPSATRRADAERVHARRHRVEPDHAVRAGPGAGAARPASTSPSSASICGSRSTSRSTRWSRSRWPTSCRPIARNSRNGRASSST